MKKLLITLLVVCLLPISRVQALDNDVTPNAKSAILIEANSRQILYDKNAEEKLYPASTTKIMTMILMFEALRNKKISFDDARRCIEEYPLSTVNGSDAGKQKTF